GPLTDPVPVTVPAGGRVDVTFPNVALTSPVPVELKGDGRNARRVRRRRRCKRHAERNRRGDEERARPFSAAGRDPRRVRVPAQPPSLRADYESAAGDAARS